MKDTEIKKIDYILALVPILLITLENTFAKIGSQFFSIDNFSILDYLNIFSILAIVCLILRSAIMLIIYRKFDISFIYPITSISYVLVLMVSVIFFSELLTIGKILGSVLILTGIYLIGSVKNKNN